MIPIDPTLLGGFIVAAVAIIVSPGPDTIVILRHALTGGRGTGLAAVSGVQLGLLVHTALAVAGISLLVASSPVLFQGLTVIGAVYLAWLGIQSLRGVGGLEVEIGAAPAGAARACREAALCNILNPKVILWFLALLPNFVNPEAGDVTTQLIALSALLIALNILWQAPMALAADGVRRWLGRPETMHAVNRVSGVILLGMAALMLGQHLL
ncbi:MAG: Homoserine/homoserine lactone efflux protein [Alphaproteobacteria bacterium MarineAlpha3_Bin3]|nr:MAG: Homoserine/homoserine lactone efflux protein [Alphaproteobacteria bacterium MarineAlpha3_Bin3]